MAKDSDETTVENAQDLSAKATQYRELARQIADERAKSALLDLAEEYEKLARRKRERQDGHMG